MLQPLALRMSGQHADENAIDHNPGGTCQASWPSMMSSMFVRLHPAWGPRQIVSAVAAEQMPLTVV